MLYIGDRSYQAIAGPPVLEPRLSIAMSRMIHYGMKCIFTLICTLTLSDLVAQSGVTVAPRVFLGGPYDSGTMLMSDALRVTGLLPLQEPYTTLGFAMLGGGGVSMSPSILSVTGNNAIVDWVLVELRHATDPMWVVTSVCALVQRDGDVVATNGVSPVAFSTMPAGNYFVAVRHRNHLGVMTASTLALTMATTQLDLTLPGTAVYGVNARMDMGGTMALWPGDANMDGVVMYAGIGNDRDAILAAVGGVIPTNVLTNVYTSEDVNMDGLVKYVGLNNDRDVVLQTIGGVLPTATLGQQVPVGTYAYSVPGTGVVDVNGNNYPTIIFGNGQEWMAENLRAISYANGEPIPISIGPVSSTGDYCCDHELDPASGALYGKLYSCYTVTDERGLCPSGWHVPNDLEWRMLESMLGMPTAQLEVEGYRGYTENVGGKLMAVSPLWDAPNLEATNESGFSALPGAMLLWTSMGWIFPTTGADGNWWTSSMFPDSGPSVFVGWARRVEANGTSVVRVSEDAGHGLSVRCIRN
jgi:uncharacterized protein (TIGR02145 family)